MLPRHESWAKENLKYFLRYFSSTQIQYEFEGFYVTMILELNKHSIYKFSVKKHNDFTEDLFVIGETTRPSNQFVKDCLAKADKMIPTIIIKRKYESCYLIPRMKIYNTVKIKI